MTVAVIGLAATGLATAKTLAERGVTVLLCDAKPESALDPTRVLEARGLSGVTLLTGSPELPHGVELVVPSPGVPPTALALTQAQARGSQRSFRPGMAGADDENVIFEG